MDELRIQVPEGMEIDRENSTFECIKFKPKGLTYNDIAKKLFKDTNTYYITNIGSISIYDCYSCYDQKNNAVTEKQCKRLLAINQLMNVAYYFNEIVDKDVCSTYRFHLCITEKGGVSCWKELSPFTASGLVYFKTAESASKAIKILGKETIKLAISL